MAPGSLLVLVAALLAAPGCEGSLRRKLSTTAGTETNSRALGFTGCYSTKKDGGWGYCGPLSCRNNYVTCPATGGGPATVGGITGQYLSGNSGKSPSGAAYSASNCNEFYPITATDVTDWAPRGRCDSTCTQVTTGVCSATFLATVIKGDGVKYAYCNDKWLVLVSSGAPSVFTANLNDVPNPPGKQGTTYVTGMSSLSSDRPQETYYPLGVTDLAASDPANNLAAFDTQTGVGPRSYLKDGTNSYGLPSDAGVATAVNGQPIFPVYNNNGKYTPQKCEVDSCNEHVGQGGGQPHFHGDMFGDEAPTRCLYGPSNYSTTAVHPPVVGFSFDGHLIYGRYLSSSAPGFNSPALDACGGHAHAGTGETDAHGSSLHDYHYHTQIFDHAVEAGQIADQGEAYTVSTPGPYKCWKADITQSTGSSALLVATSSAAYVDKKTMSNRCCGMTDYYTLTGIAMAAEDIAASSSCAAPAAPDKGSYTGTKCATLGSSLQSGWTCHPTCESGYKVSGITMCVKGTISSKATCVASSSTTTPPTSCPSGQEPNTANTACAACADGKVSTAVDLTACAACTSPKVPNTGKTACVAASSPATGTTSGTATTGGTTTSGTTTGTIATGCDSTDTDDAGKSCPSGLNSDGKCPKGCTETYTTSTSTTGTTTGTTPALVEKVDAAYAAAPAWTFSLVCAAACAVLAASTS